MVAFHNYVLILVLILSLKIERQGVVSAAQHVVGGSQGWDVSTDLTSWVSGQTFKLDDQLVFKYTSLHSVVELADENAYKSCQTSNSLNSMSTGNDVVKLNKQGTRYFACGTPGHCAQGMKVKISIGTSSSSSSSSPTTSATTTSGAAAFTPSFAPFSFMGMSFLVILILQPYLFACL